MMKMYKAINKVIDIKLIIGISWLFVLISCSSGEKITLNSNKEIVLSETEKSEYNYALTEATKQKLFGNLRQAAVLYNTCLSVNKNSDVAYYELGNIYMMTGDIENAIKHTYRATKINGLNYWYKAQLAQLYILSQKVDSAIIIYQEMYDTWPEKIEISYDLARLYSENGEYDKAFKILNKIEKENGISEPISMLKEQIFVKQKKFEDAINELLKLLELFPEEVRIMGILAELYSSMEKNIEAEKIYRKIIEIEPDNGLALLSYAEHFRNVGESEMQYELFKKAFNSNNLPLEQKMQVVISLLTDKNEFYKFRDKISDLINILAGLYPDDYRIKVLDADFLYKNGKLEEAVEEYRSTLSLQRRNYFIWEQIIVIESQLNNNSEVYKICSEAIKIFPEKPMLYLLMSEALINLERFDEAENVLEKGVKLDEMDNALKVQFYSMFAQVYRSKNEHLKSDEYFEKALQLNPENLMILNNYSYYLALRGEKLAKAEKMSKKTIIAEPDNPTYLDTYAWVLFGLNQFGKAKEYIEKALQNGGNNNEVIMEHFGYIMLKLNKKKEAIEAWKKAVELGNNNNNIKEFLMQEEEK